MKNKIITYLHGLQLFVSFTTYNLEDERAFSITLSKILTKLTVNNHTLYCFSSITFWFVMQQVRTMFWHVMAFSECSIYPFWYKMLLARPTYFIVDMSGHLGVMFEGLSAV